MADELTGRLDSLSPAKRKLLLERLRQKAADKEPAAPPLTPVPRPPGGAMPLSFGQQQLWLIEQLAPGSPLYDVPAQMAAEGRLDAPALAAALAAVLQRHEALRTRFVRVEGEPRQVVVPAPAFILPLVDLSGLPEQRRRPEALDVAARQRRRGFDLESGLLLRAALLRLEPELHALLLDIHHIASDGLSVGVLVRELAALYAAARSGRPADLPDLPIQYADFAWHQRQRLQGERLEEMLGYWRDRLADLPPPLPLPLDRPRPPVRSTEGRTAGLAPFDLPVQQGATLFVTLLAGLQALLARITGQTDVVVGTVVANRHRPELEGLIGYFVNTLALRTGLDGDPPFLDLLARARETAVGAFAHQELPFEKLVEDLRPERDLSLTPLFQVALALEPEPVRALKLPDLTLRALGEADEGTIKFDLTLSATQEDGEDGGLSLSASYDAALFDASTVRRLLGGYARLLAGAAARPETPLSALPLLSEAESHQVTREWNDTAAAATAIEELPVHLQVAALARRTPGAPAVLDPRAGSSPLTYGELEARARRLRRLLRVRGVLEDRVAICLERSAGAVLAMQAILGAGAAFVPLDPAHPAERLAFMLEDSGARVLLTRRPLLEAFSPRPDVEVICLDEIKIDEPDQSRESDGLDDLGAAGTVPVLPETLCYVLYTSGSTGRPKGVAIEHRGLSNLVVWTRRTFEISPRDRATYLMGPSFDGTIFEIWPSLVSGACLEVIEDEVRLSPAALLDRLTASGITLSSMPTPLCEGLLGEIERRQHDLDALALRVLATGGDRLHRLPSRPLPFKLFNLYGPTENSVNATGALVRDWSASASPPIGRPMGNVRVYVLDAGLRPVPAGVAGELCAAGAGLARGYFGRPDQTAECFVPDPLSGGPGGRLYRTGDRVRLLADGRIEFLGRGDRQVKIRGFRVEPGEVEGVLAEHPAVRACAVVVDQGAPGGPQLVAYAEVGSEGVAGSGDLSSHLRRRLPVHMVPTAFVLLEALPLTAHGKVDRAALLGLRPRRQASAELLRNAAEEAVAAVWREVLGVPAVGPDDNFFDLGGHSLLLVQIHERLLKQFPRLEVLDLFRFPTVAALAAHLASPQTPASAPLDSREGAAPPAEHRGGASARGDVAVIGMAGRFPGAWSVEELWRNLASGVESIRLLGREDLEQAGVDPAMAASPAYVPASAACDGADLFDAGFFGFTPREAEATDPQHRLFLECAWQALENAGYDPAAYPGRIGVFGGSSLGGYGLRLHSNPEAVRRLGVMQAKLGIDRDFLATRISYKLGLTGPSLTVQTACSTSLVAVHLACRSLLAGECDMALAGGVSIYSAGGAGYVYEEGSILSPDGHCRAFDAAGRGTVPGEGVGLVVLKRLADALADGDSVDAVIRGSAINNDGSQKVGYTAPAIDGQAAVIRAALAAASVDPGTVTYVEAHGTGTPLGDPIEVAALRQAFGAAGAGDHGCALGSIKTNLGHLDCAAGVAGLIKTVLALRHRLIPPSLHFATPNPQIDFGDGRFHVNTAAAAWDSAGPRRAGVSSFGIGGTNAHAVLEEAPSRPVAAVRDEGWQLLLLSARSGEALEHAGVDLANHLERHPDLEMADVAWTLQTGRRAFDHRRAVVCRDLEEARQALASLDPGRVLTGVRSADRPVAFLFPGQGSQRADMARGLYAARPAFRAEVDRAAEVLHPSLGLDLRDLLFPPAEKREEAAVLLGRTRFTQPALFVIEHALSRLWISWGIEPWALLGHSIGEYVAACLAGVFTLEDALGLVARRGQLVEDLPPGAMLAVPLPAEELAALLGPELSLAAVNAADRSVAAGPAAAVDDLRRRLAARGVEGRPLATSHAFHSAMMEPAMDALAQAVAAVPRQPPRLPFLSNVTGTWITAEEATDPAYWGRHLRASVRFADGVRELLARPGVLLEVGPGETLGRLARREARHRSADTPAIAATLPSATEETALPDEAHLLRAAGRLWLAGARLDWRAVHGGHARRRVHLPTYPFERRRYWLAPGPGVAVQPPEREAPRQAADLTGWFYLPSWKRSLPPPIPTENTGLPAGEVLVFLDADGLGNALAARLRAAGRSVVTVEAGDLFAGLGDGAFVLRPGEPGDYDALLDALPGAGREDSAIVHLWSFGAPRGEGFEAAVDRAFYSPLFLAQTLARRRIFERRLDLWLVSSHLHDVWGGDPVVPERSLLLGPSKVIPLELPGVACRSLDFEPGAPIERTLDRILAEMAAVSAGPEASPVIAWRGRQRWLQSFEPVRLEEGSGSTASRLRPGGVYLITGGHGGVGHAVALWLARTVSARLVLVGRTAVPPRERWDESLASHEDDPLARRVRRLRELEEAGAEVLVVQADVTDAEALARARNLVRERWGTGVHGVIHAAGVPGGGEVIPRQDRESAGAVLAPKVQGTLVLAGVFPPEELDLFVLFSSLNSVMGACGQVACCAANAFLDAFAASRPGDVVSIDWDLWEETGMAVETASPAEPVSSGGGLTAAEGVEAFRRILAGVDLPQVMVSVRDLTARVAETAAMTGDRLLAELDDLERDGGAAPAGPRHGRPDLVTPYVAPRTEAEQRLAEIWGDLLGIDVVGIHDDFFELGGDSVLGLRIVARARDRGLVLTPAQLFERPTIAGLAAGLEAAAVEEPSAETPAEAQPPSPEAGAYDPASFPDADVSQRDLEALLAQLGGT